jgi:hypothetical protein
MEPVWTKAQVAAHQRGLATARKTKAAIDRLLELAKHNPAFAERIRDLADMRDHLELSCATALEIDPAGKPEKGKG